MKLTCLIPCYNEGPRISNIIELALNHPLIDRVIVIDDCSTDDAVDKIKQFPRAELLQNTANLGKTKSIAKGMRLVTSPYLLLLDADLLNLTNDDLTALIEPVLSGAADVSISLRGNAPFLWRWIGIDYISGERVMPLKLFSGQFEALESLPKFGLEVFMNKLILQNSYRISITPWPDVSSPYKSKKRGFWAGLWGEVKMILDIFKVLPPHRVISQILAMKRDMV